MSFELPEPHENYASWEERMARQIRSLSFYADHADTYENDGIRDNIWTSRAVEEHYGDKGEFGYGGKGF